MFDDIVARYDLLNGILSLGLDRRWRRATVEALRIGPGERVLDLGCGTGDLSRLLAGAGGRVVGIDISHGMLRGAKAKLRGDTQLALGSAFALPMRDRTFAAAGSAFVLRNLFDLETAFRELARVLEPGGRLALVDITEPKSRLLRHLFDAYFGTVAPALGALVGKRDAYRYLVRSVAQLPPPAEVCAILERAGFDDARATPLTGGMVTLFTAMRAHE
jgi:demethylmenaquinone methyltransferase / 2-methoxy-6-polyprenyl-1,4-benzoquinol methylase